MPLQQLQQQRNAMQQELQEMKTRHRSMLTAAKRYLESLRTVEMVENAEPGQKMLVPMNDSIFVPGELNDTEHVTVEIGTGFFVKRTIPDAKEYLERKVKNVNLYIERVGVNILANPFFGHTGQKMLVPMNDSIFVPGELNDTEHVTVEIGTGFFVKRTIPDAKEYLERKVKNVNLYIERVGVNILAQENNLAQIDDIFRARVQMVKQQADGNDRS
eukprot:CAMPEP_0171549404 /NCGR_PEP_ID=MMETSP0960-20121227/6416_1 /TAXON_ID=87120 /ORGANISM="Aurantiochytrium limacinum, Strain ATCCMYA-1381" /LENGTH=215 /DNA_ID=CAMNT_0012098077 /DNA_START=164 /DNA_END=811 /DNA_ORIENTATION=+